MRNLCSGALGFQSAGLGLSSKVSGDDDADVREASSCRGDTTISDRPRAMAAGLLLFLVGTLVSGTAGASCKPVAFGLGERDGETSLSFLARRDARRSLFCSTKLLLLAACSFCFDTATAISSSCLRGAGAFMKFKKPRCGGLGLLLVLLLLWFGLLLAVLLSSSICRYFSGGFRSGYFGFSFCWAALKMVLVGLLLFLLGFVVLVVAVAVLAKGTTMGTLDRFAVVGALLAKGISVLDLLAALFSKLGGCVMGMDDTGDLDRLLVEGDLLAEEAPLGALLFNNKLGGVVL